MRPAPALYRALLAALCLSAAVPAASGADCPAEAPCTVAGGEYAVALPQGVPVGAVFFLHGFGGSGPAELRNTKLVGAFTDQGYAVIAPSAMARAEDDARRAWNAQANPAGRDDVAFLSAVADDAARRFGFPRERVLAAGFSLGGMMVWRLACDAPDAFAAYAPVAGLFWEPFPATCKAPFAMLHTHGWIDPTVPLEGRALRSGTLVQGDLFAGLELLRRTLGCRKDAPDSYDAQGDMLLRRWSACAPGGELTLALHPGGHWVPDSWAPLARDWFEALPGVTETRACVKDAATGRC